MNEEELLRIIKEIQDVREAEKIKPDELTHTMYAERAGCSVNVAKRILQDEVSKGRMTCRHVRIEGGHKAWAYKLV